MGDRASELQAILATVRARWSRRAFLRAWSVGAWAAAGMLMVGLLAVILIAQEGVPLVFVVGTAVIFAGIALSFALLPLSQPPSDRQIARFIEEQAGGLDEVVVTAVDKLESGSGPVVDLIVGDAVRAARMVDPHRIVTNDTMSRAIAGAAVGSAAFLIAFYFFAPSAERAIDVAGSYLFPRYYTIEVAPGSIKVREGQPLTITARIPGVSGGLVPTITVGTGDAARSARMTAGAKADEFTITLNNIAVSFPYVVSAGSARSADYQIDVIRPVRVSRIDLRYEYAPGLGLESHTEEDGGDIYAPAGTKVELTITADKPVARGQLTMSEGPAIALNGHDQVLTANLVVSKDGSYRVTLNDADGLSNGDGTEYFIRMLNDRPPDVRILRPAGDKQVSPLEEVEIEARADDDYGVRSLELVIKSNTGKEKVFTSTRAPARSRRSARSGQAACRRHSYGVSRRPEREAWRRGDVSRARDGCRPRAQADRIAKRHLLPRGQAIRRGVCRRREQRRRHGRAGDRARGLDRPAERHHGRDVEARCPRAPRRQRRPVLDRHQGRGAGADLVEEQDRGSGCGDGRRPRRTAAPPWSGNADEARR